MSGSGAGAPAAPNSSASVPVPALGAPGAPGAPGPPGAQLVGVRLGVDVGTVRIGVAASDPAGRIATPVETVPRDPTAGGGEGADLDRLAALTTERGAVEVLVGLPRSLSGAEGPAAVAARDYAQRLAQRIHPVPVRLVDERLTTVTATRALREAGVVGRHGGGQRQRGGQRQQGRAAQRGRVGERRDRAVIDQVAAAVLLQAALDAGSADRDQTTTPNPTPADQTPEDQTPDHPIQGAR